MTLIQVYRVFVYKDLFLKHVRSLNVVQQKNEHTLSIIGR